MIDAIDELKLRAKRLQRAAEAGEPAAQARLGRLRPQPERLQRKHCLDIVARELGFRSFQHARRVLEGDPAEQDFGDLLCQRSAGSHLNHWCTTHPEAREVQVRHGGYILAYRRQFLVVQRSYVETLGLDPDDPDWERIGRDWPRPRDPEARRRLYALVVAQTRPPAGC